MSTTEQIEIQPVRRGHRHHRHHEEEQFLPAQEVDQQANQQQDTEQIYTEVQRIDEKQDAKQIHPIQDDTWVDYPEPESDDNDFLLPGVIIFILD